MEEDESIPRSYQRSAPVPVLILHLFRSTHISGSAYKIVAQRAYHHGTMLISSDLGSLGTYLRSKSVSRFSRSNRVALPAQESY